MSGLILDPFSGTATTGLVAAQAGLNAHLYDINPFLIWFGRVKCANYSPEQVAGVRENSRTICDLYPRYLDTNNWTPNIHRIERWWSPATLTVLSALRRAIVEVIGGAQDDLNNGLIWVAFCRLIIESSAAAFNHVSLSFHADTPSHTADTLEQLFRDILDQFLADAIAPLPGQVQFYHQDSRQIWVDTSRYTHVITSPPYPNRISYIRELRPYMYWTKFLDTARQAGNLDWQAIGGTWGVATSRLQKWQPTVERLPAGLYTACTGIAESQQKNGLLMSRYVHRYFEDMYLHLASLRYALAPQAQLRYIVGNATFYGIRVETEQWLADILRDLGYQQISTAIIRKRNSKKALFEFCVSGVMS